MCRPFVYVTAHSIYIVMAGHCTAGEGEEEPISSSMPENVEGLHPSSLLYQWNCRKVG
jgi:hypothetical protein